MLLQQSWIKTMCQITDELDISMEEGAKVLGVDEATLTSWIGEESEPNQFQSQVILGVMQEWGNIAIGQAVERARALFGIEEEPLLNSPFCGSTESKDCTENLSGQYL